MTIASDLFEFLSTVISAKGGLDQTRPGSPGRLLHNRIAELEEQFAAIASQLVDSNAAMLKAGASIIEASELLDETKRLRAENRELELQVSDLRGKVTGMRNAPHGLRGQLLAKDQYIAKLEAELSCKCDPEEPHSPECPEADRG